MRNAIVEKHAQILLDDNNVFLINKNLPQKTHGRNNIKM